MANNNNVVGFLAVVQVDMKNLQKEDLQTGGTFSCAGCNAILGLKLALKVLGKNTIVVNSSGCMTLTATYPFTPYKVPWIHGAIENGASIAAGIMDGLKQQGKDANVLVYAGDGATYDIGIQSLSGAAYRNDNIIYICYNNSSFGNTGFQASSATPFGSYTFTTPFGKENPIGNLLPRKNMAKIIAEHNSPYVATACTAYAFDFMNKLEKASKIKGCKFIDLLTPCPTGWGHPVDGGVEIGKMMVESGIWPLYEIQDKQLTITHKPKFIPVKDVFKNQQRFRHLSGEMIEKIQELIKKEWETLESRYYTTKEY